MRALATALALSLLPAAAKAQVPAPGTPVTVDGPSSSIAEPSGLQMAIARDGTGALVYLKQVSGTEHVFVSRLVGGAFQPPIQIDPALSGASSQPVVAAGNGGVLLIGFVNQGNLYLVDRAGISSPYTVPRELFGGAINPSIQMTNFGKAYLAFTAEEGSGQNNVRTAYYYLGKWALESAPLNAVPDDDAGTGAGRPQVAAAGDGVSIVVWGEAGHIYSRRVWGTAPSVVDEQADGPLPGCTELSAGDPVVGAGGDSSYVGVAFHEQLSCGATDQSRVLLNRLRGSEYDGITQPDGLSASQSGSADDPQIAVGEYGAGFVTSERQDSNDLYATELGQNVSTTGNPFEVNSLPNASPPYGVPALAGLYSDLIAWQHDPGVAGVPDVRIRYSNKGSALDPELQLSSPSLGPTDAADGLVAAGDVDGNAAVAWVQGSSSQPRIVADLLYRLPGAVSALKRLTYARIDRPVLRWHQAHEHWGPLQYRVTLDGVQLAQTEATAIQVPTALADGPHTWSVTAVNPGGLQSSSAPSTEWIDTTPPAVHVELFGKKRAGTRLHVYVSYTDAPPPVPPRDASGIASVVVRWGDGTVVRIRLGAHRSYHTYRRRGRYKLTVIVTDRAGNVSTKVVRLTIAPRHSTQGSARE